MNKTKTLLPAALLTLLLVACGGSDTESSASTTVAEEAAAATTDAMMAETSTPEAAAPADPAVAEFCTSFTEFLNHNPASGTTPEEVEATMTEARENVAAMIELAPEDVRADTEALQSVFDEIDKVLADSGYDQESTNQEEVIEIAEKLAEPMSNLSEFIATNCGGALSLDSTPSSTIG